MGGARKFQLGGSRGQRAGQGGQAYGQGHLDFFYSGWAGTHTDKRRMHAQVEFAFDIARLWKKICCFVQGQCHICVFLKMGNNFASGASEKIFRPHHTRGTLAA